MHGNSQGNRLLMEGLVAGAGAIRDIQCAVCVPFPYLHQARSLLAGTGVHWGAQNVSQWQEGAYTGEVSAAMLADFDCRFVVVGHSERRSLFCEGDGAVAAKAGAVLEQGMTPIICVGESLDERERNVTETVVSRQLDAVLDAIGVDGMDKSVLAYEPVWAIGTGKTATPEQAQAVHAYLRARIAALDEAVAARLTVVYGGSVKAANAEALFAMEDIDGGLIGGASLDVGQFLAICQAASR